MGTTVKSKPIVVYTGDWYRSTVSFEIDQEYAVDGLIPLTNISFPEKYRTYEYGLRAYVQTESDFDEFELLGYEVTEDWVIQLSEDESWASITVYIIHRLSDGTYEDAGYYSSAYIEF